ncbi:hypothetical protein ACF9IK_10530 [Kitasatospora hibisci]|uniref:hypothetical protein n=1 Tax=Kitasatospora hibisci TaxID=3369522 RepID=UPI0037551C26
MELVRAVGRTPEASPWLRRMTVIAGLTVSAMTLSSCGADTIAERRKATITLEQAKSQVDSYLAEIQAKLPVQPLASTLSDFSDLECDHNDVGPHGRKETARGYGFGDVPLEAKAEANAAFRSLLMGKGFELAPDATTDWVKLKNPKNKFIAVLSGVSDGSRNLSLKVSTPCVWPNGTPSP